MTTFSEKQRQRLRTLHIVQGGVNNGDKAWLQRAARLHLSSAATWVVPKSAQVGDEVVVYVGSYGFFATARIKSAPRPRKDWPNRYGASLTSIRLIRPAISLAAIRRGIEKLTWAIYPRSITAPPPEVAQQIRTMIANRRESGLPDLDAPSLEAANIDELRRVALLKARPVVSGKRRSVIYRARSLAIRLYVLRRANGQCEGCGTPAPFFRVDGSPYLEPHHITRLADDGPDHPARVIGLCPNCHRRAHFADDKKRFNDSLTRRVGYFERRFVKSI